jgi:hypothetical protein
LSVEYDVQQTYEVISNDIAILIVDGESIGTVLDKKFDGNELPLTTTRQEIIAVYTNRDIKKLVSNELLRCAINSLAAPTGIGALDRRPKARLETSFLRYTTKLTRIALGSCTSTNITILLVGPA